MTFPFFTIVVVGYQSEPYLAKALGSIDRQTFLNFDVMCIVEESTDNSLGICSDWAKSRTGCTVVSLPKSGSASCSRNYAIDHAKGKYLVFVDGDDWLADDMLTKLHEKLAEGENIDILSFAATETRSDPIDRGNTTRITNFRPQDTYGVFSGLDAIRRTRHVKRLIEGYSWLSTYRTLFLRENHLYQKPGLYFEDFEHTTRAWASARKMAYVDAELYVYRRRPHSATTSLDTKFSLDLFYIVRSLLDFAYECHVPHDILAIWSDQWLATLFWTVFHPITSRKLSDKDRDMALSLLKERNGLRLLWQFASNASMPKRLATAFVILAAMGPLLPAKLFFRWIYYPLVARRDKR